MNQNNTLVVVTAFIALAVVLAGLIAVPAVEKAQASLGHRNHKNNNNNNNVLRNELGIDNNHFNVDDIIHFHFD